jgi:hypothetical protein
MTNTKMVGGWSWSKVEATLALKMISSRRSQPTTAKVLARLQLAALEAALAAGDVDSFDSI